LEIKLTSRWKAVKREDVVDYEITKIFQNALGFQVLRQGGNWCPELRFGGPQKGGQ